MISNITCMDMGDMDVVDMDVMDMDVMDMDVMDMDIVDMDVVDMLYIFNCILLYSKWDRVMTGHGHFSYKMI